MRSWCQNNILSAYDCGYSANQDSLRRQHEQISQIQDPGLTVDMLMPNWEGQWSRLLVPCADAGDYMWFRTGKVITLGELFLALGEVYTAAAIYTFYRTLRIVVLKRQKTKSYKRGSASASTGLTGGPLQASTMKRRLCLNRSTKEYLVAEFCKAAGLGNRPVSMQLLDAAVRHMHKILLLDLNPPG